jgi:uncharacterized protein
MLLDLSRMHEARERVERTYPPSSFEVADEFLVVDPVRLSFDVTRDKNRFRLVGRVQTALTMPCSRCLDDFRIPVEIPFDLSYVPAAENTGEGEREIQDDDLSTAFYRDETIDLGQLMREQFYLALPMKPLCREDCAGLCPQCGANRNRTTCVCDARWEDPRLAPLKGLVKRETEN